MRILLPTLVALLLVVAGCIDPDRDTDDNGSTDDDVNHQGPGSDDQPPIVLPPDTRPPDWNETPELAIYTGARLHNANQTLRAAPPDNISIERPVMCAAYQLGQRQPDDTCTVGGPDAWDGQSYGPWTVQAFWYGGDDNLIAEERDESRRTVVAFDADGEPVAHVPEARALAIE